MDSELKIKDLRIKELEDELQTTKEHLKKYTAPASRKIYYENNKEVIKERVKEHKQQTGYKYKPTPEQRKKWAKTAYINRKEKLEKEKLEKEKLENNGNI